jgi:hypothetical protein
MTSQEEQEILKGCGKEIPVLVGNKIYCGNYSGTYLCPSCQAKLEDFHIVEKMKDEEIEKIRKEWRNVFQIDTEVIAELKGEIKMKDEEIELWKKKYYTEQKAFSEHNDRVSEELKKKIEDFNKIKEDEQYALDESEDGYKLKTNDELIDIICDFGCGGLEFHTADIERLIIENNYLKQNLLSENNSSSSVRKEGEKSPSATKTAHQDDLCENCLKNEKCEFEWEHGLNEVICSGFMPKKA